MTDLSFQKNPFLEQTDKLNKSMNNSMLRREGHFQDQLLHLTSIELLNFKSFEGTHLIGPFLSFTAIIGPNGSGKSNVLDALAFALLLKHISTKHKHLSELIYREEHENHRDNRREMSVMINFKATNIQDQSTKDYSIKRMINRNGVQEYFFNGTPLIGEEYLAKINEMHLNINNFCAYQGKLEQICFKQEGGHLVQMFEELSGSYQFKAKYDELKQNIAKCDEKIKQDSEILHTLRIEKVKLKGLQEFVEQMKDCLVEQKEVESQLSIAQILISHKNIQALRLKMQEYERGIQDTIQQKQASINDLKKFEADMRKLQNQEEQVTKKIKSKKDELLGLQNNVFNKQKEVDTSKSMITQKKQMLQKFQYELEDTIKKRALHQETIEKARHDLQLLNKEIVMNEDLQQQDALRDEYLTIKSRLESENAQIGRQMTMIEQKIQSLNQKKANIQGHLFQQKEQNKKVQDLDMIKQELKALEADLKEKDKSYSKAQNEHRLLLDEATKNKDKVKTLEKQLLEKEYELKDIENERNIKSQDQKLSQTLEELKNRCKGYLGQLYELIKPINAKYDIAVKVALSKCLRFLVVDTPQTAEYCTEFLKEKGLFKDVLVLQNVPEKNINSKLAKELKTEGNLVYDVIEVSRKHHHIERAVRYFLGDKVVCKEFDTAIKLQRMGVKDIVTEDGKEFKPGMISGGQQTNIFNLNLGNFKMDRDIKKLAEEIQTLENQLNQLKESEYGESSLQKIIRDVSRLETEIEILQGKIQNKKNQIKNFEENQKETVAILKQFETQIADFDKQLNQAHQAKQALQSDLQEASDEAFSGFLKKIGVNSIEEYEHSRDNEQARNFNVQKNQLLQVISQHEAELQFIEKNDSSKHDGISAIENILKQEEDKLAALMSDQYQAEVVQKLQTEIKDMNDDLLNIKKQSSEITSQQFKVKQQNDLIQTRFDHFQKEITVHRIQIKNEESEKQARIEEGQLNMIINVQNDADAMAQIDFNHKLGIDNIDEIAQEEVQEIIQIKKEKLRKLRSKEDEFNKNAALVPESDPNVSMINDKIQQVKDDVDKLSQERTQYSSELKKVQEQRVNIFINFFDNVSQILQDTYQKLTMKDSNLNQGGKVTIFIEDRQNPFDKSIHYFPQPPNKSHIYDISQLSGGEKTVAALALIFSLIQIRRPPMLLLDEVDAFLDVENVQLVTDFIKNELKTQTLIISHKEFVIKNTLSLIGASFVKDQKTSMAYSLDLRNYKD
eukprot:403376057